MQLSAKLGVLAGIICIVYAYTYLLKGVSTYLPWYLSMAITGMLALVGRFETPVEHLLVGVLVHVYPVALHGTFIDLAAWGSPVASFLMKLSSALLTVLQLWVILRLGIGLLRQGEAFTSSRAYQRWSETPEGFPGVVEIFDGYRERWRQVFGTSSSTDGAVNLQDDPATTGSMTPGPLADHLPAERGPMQSSSQKLARAKRRQANRNARKARRARR